MISTHTHTHTHTHTTHTHTHTDTQTHTHLMQLSVFQIPDDRLYIILLSRLIWIRVQALEAEFMVSVFHVVLGKISITAEKWHFRVSR